MYEKIQEPLTSQLPGIFRKGALIADMAEVFDKLYNTLVEDPRITLQRLHVPYHPDLEYPSLERYYLIEKAREYGFDFTSDVMTDENYRHLVESLPEYYRSKSGTDFVKMIGYMRGIKFEMVQLWCDSGSDDDFIVFYNEKQGLSITEGGTWYPTSHVELTYNGNDHPVIYTQEINDLFYIMAPINLVLRHITGALEATGFNYYYPVGLSTTYHYAQKTVTLS